MMSYIVSDFPIGVIACVNVTMNRGIAMDTSSVGTAHDGYENLHEVVCDVIGSTRLNKVKEVPKRIEIGKHPHSK
jgi:hypothetical protein